jgi:Cu(I)/Ag(I) efflux system membrane protein CusA/SilA
MDISSGNTDSTRPAAARVIAWCVDNRVMVIMLTLFVVIGGILAMSRTPLDAIPDLSDVQVIIYSRWQGRDPQTMEDQVTYPLTTAMLAVPKVKVVRGYSFFGFSFVYAIFEDGTDIYWARSRVLEYLNQVGEQIPDGVETALGPDASGVGWVYQYTLEDPSRRYDLGDLRAIQDWYVRYQLMGVPGVAEVASIGGFVRQYQITVDPNLLQAYGVPLKNVISSVKRSNNDVGGRLLEMSETEYMVRGRGYIKGIEDVEKVVVKAAGDNTAPVLLRDVARIQMGPDIRRGIAEKNGEGEVVGGIVVMRYGENALDVIGNVKTKIAEISAGLPEGVEIHTAYDRSALIERSIDTLSHELIQQMIIVVLVCVLFLWHVRSALVAAVSLPLGILVSFVVMRILGINANIMSLGGIAIAIGAMVDAAVVLVENAHKHLERRPGVRGAERWRLIKEASIEVGPSLFFSLLIITVSFLPVFALQEQAGRLFKPLAYTKTFAMAAAAVIAVTITPVLMGYFIRGKIHPEATVQTGTPLDTPPPQAGARAGEHRPGGDVVSLPEAGLGVHAAAERRRHPLHADIDARHFRNGSETRAADAGQVVQDVSRGRRRVRQGRTGGDSHGPGASHHGRDDGHAQGPARMAGALDRGSVCPQAGEAGTRRYSRRRGFRKRREDRRRRGERTDRKHGPQVRPGADPSVICRRRRRRNGSNGGC